MKKQDIIDRVNKGCNFLTDTKDIDYTEGLSWTEIIEQDTSNIEVAFLFKQELRESDY